MRQMKKLIVMCVTVPFLLINCKSVMAENGTSGKPEVVVLIDTSKSISPEKQEEEIEWAGGICARSKGQGILVNFLTFDSDENDSGFATKTLLEKTVLTDDKSLNDALEKISSIQYEGRFTDLDGAMHTAMDIFDPGSTKKCIVILSDGRLDYDNDDEKDTKNKEAYAREDFIKTVKNFDEQENQHVILVEFEGMSFHQYHDDDWEKLEDGRFEKNINLFRELKDAKIDFFGSSEDIQNSSPKIFRELGFDDGVIDSGPFGKQKGSIRFKLEQNYDSVYIFVKRKRNDGSSALSTDDFKLFYKDEECPRTNVQILSNSAFIILRNNEAGNYKLQVSENDEWGYNIEYVEKTKLEKIELAVWKNDTELPFFYEKYEEKDVKVYEVMFDDADNDIILHASVQGDIPKTSRIKLTYYNFEDGKELNVINQYKISDTSNPEQYMSAEPLDREGEIFFRAEGVDSDEVVVNSNTVKVLARRKEAELIEKSESCKTGEETDVFDILGLAYDEKLKVYVREDNNKAILEEKGIYSWDGRKLIFESEGLFDVQIYDSKGNNTGVVHYTVEKEEKVHNNSGFFARVRQWCKDHHILMPF